MAERAVFRRNGKRRKQRLSRQRLLTGGTWRMAYEARGRINDGYQHNDKDESDSGGALARDATQPSHIIASCNGQQHDDHLLDNASADLRNADASPSVREQQPQPSVEQPPPPSHALLSSPQPTNENRAPTSLPHQAAREQRCEQACEEEIHDHDDAMSSSSSTAAAATGGSRREDPSGRTSSSNITTQQQHQSTASTWSLPCKLNNNNINSSSSSASKKHRIKSSGFHHYPGPSSSHNNNNNSINSAAADTEAERRARCFYRYRNLHPRAVAYLFSRRHEQADAEQVNATTTTTTTTVVARRPCYPADRGRNAGRGRRVGERNDGLVPTTYVNYSPSNNNTNNTTQIPNNNNNNETNPSTVLSAELLPDLLNSHIPPPPPYSTLPPPNSGNNRVTRNVPNVPPAVSPPSPPRRPSFLAPGLSLIGGGGGGRRGRSGEGRRRGGGGSHYTPDDEPKHCCGVVVSQAVSIRWFILMIAFVGLCCAVVGTVLGALKTTGREHLTVSLLMIGVGIVLITVSGIAWRLTSTDAPSCRMMLGFHTDDTEPNRRFVPRVPPSYGRSHHPYAAMMYPEFQYRPPPPSYQASMQEYRLRLLLLDRQQAPNNTPSLSPVSPPPTYRSHISGRPPLTFSRESDYSHPPSYRSRSSSVMPRPTIDGQIGMTTEGETAASGTHSRDPSLSLSCLSHESLFELSEGNGIGARETRRSRLEVTGNSNYDRPTRETECIVHSSMATDGPNYGNNKSWSCDYPAKTTNESGARDGQPPHPVWKNRDSNLVTIVQTTDSTQVLNQDAVVVTVSGQNSNALPSSVQGEVEILAHL